MDPSRWLNEKSSRPAKGRAALSTFPASRTGCQMRTFAHPPLWDTSRARSSGPLMYWLALEESRPVTRTVLPASAASCDPQSQESATARSQ